MLQHLGFSLVFVQLFTLLPSDMKLEKETLIQIIAILSVLSTLLIVYELFRFFRNNRHKVFLRFFRKVQLEIVLQKDRPLRPQFLTMTIRNTGKREACIESPVLEFRKIWTKRKFKLSGKSGQNIYPMFIDPGNAHQLHIETTTFHQYDRSIKSYYFARIRLTDVDGRKWKSNSVKLRKSLFT